MYSKFQLLRKYIQYKLQSSNSKGHGVHSPFVFNFITRILNDESPVNAFKSIEQRRHALKKDGTILNIEDFGAGSRVNSHYQRSVSSIARSALKPAKFGQLLFRMVNHFQPATILELGTSLGITTAYMASANTHADVITMEGATEVAKTAESNFEKLGLKNVRIVRGNFDETLESTLGEIKNPIDFAFLDGNHRREPTINYFLSLLPKINENSILIFDDVHWSKEMEEAWEYIKQHESVTLSIDLFFIGIAFFRKENLEKQHFTINF